MNLFDKLERKFRKYAISNLMMYISGISLFVFLMDMLMPTAEVMYKLALVPSLVLKGEVWRLITYIFIPPASSPIFVFFVLYFYYMMGSALEHQWGSFRFNLYYLIGMLATTIVACIVGGGTSAYLHSSIFLAFAKLFPNYEILIFFFFPIKIKYMAYLEWFIVAMTVIFAPFELKVIALVSLLNYFVFFSKDIIMDRKNVRTSYINRRDFHSKMPKIKSMHKCTTCGITEIDNPQMDFRYCSKCNGDYEYCMDHLKNHQHMTGE